MRSIKVVQVLKKYSGDEARFEIILPPSALNIRASDRVVSLKPKTKGFCVLLATNSVALRVDGVRLDWTLPTEKAALT